MKIMSKYNIIYHMIMNEFFDHLKFTITITIKKKKTLNGVPCV